MQTGTHLVKPLTVEVKDAAGAPVENAAVIFRLPDSGPSGTFADGTVTSVVYTDAAGRASSGEIQWGGIPGSVSLRITAAKGTGHAGVLFTETLTGATPAVAVAPPQPAQATVLTRALPPKPSQSTPAKPGVLASSTAPTPGVVIERVGSTSIDANSAGSNSHRSRKPRPSDDEDAETPQSISSPAATTRYADDDSPDANVPVRHAFSNQPEDDSAGVSVTRVGAGEASPGSGHHLTRWLVIAAVAAGAGVALAMVRKGSGSSSSGVTIGAPSVSVGHP
jgi:hypothetical protein